MGDKGHVTLICCGNCAHDFGREFRKILKELKKADARILSMDELDPKDRSKYYHPPKGRGRCYPACSVCGCYYVNRHRIKWRRNETKACSG